MKIDINNVIAANGDVIAQWATGIASGRYFDGTSWQMYLDTRNNTLLIHQAATDQTRIVRDGLIFVWSACGRADTSYPATDADAAYISEITEQLRDALAGKYHTRRAAAKYYARIIGNDISEMCYRAQLRPLRARTLAAAKREATIIYGDGYRHHSIIIVRPDRDDDLALAMAGVIAIRDLSSRRWRNWGAR